MRSRCPYQKAACLRWPWATWIEGEGAFASVSYCRGRWKTTVLLCPTQREAELKKAAIDGQGCGGRCVRLHRVEELLLPIEDLKALLKASWTVK
jgi:hypothetical protein